MALAQQHGADLRGMQTDLADRIDRALQGGRQVFVFNLIGERHEKQRSYPWSQLEDDCGPDTFLSVLEKYQHERVYPLSHENVGIIRLRPRKGSESTGL